MTSMIVSCGYGELMASGHWWMRIYCWSEVSCNVTFISKDQFEMLKTIIRWLSHRQLIAWVQRLWRTWCYLEWGASQFLMTSSWTNTILVRQRNHHHYLHSHSWLKINKIHYNRLQLLHHDSVIRQAQGWGSSYSSSSARWSMYDWPAHMSWCTY